MQVKLKSRDTRALKLKVISATFPPELKVISALI
jgi:hypothetical protein